MATSGILGVGLSGWPCRSDVVRQSGLQRRVWSLQVRAAGRAAEEGEVSTEEAPGLVKQASILSADAIKKVIAGELPVRINHYGRLGLPRTASEGQIRETYRRLVQEVREQESEEQEKARMLRGLRESYELLTNVEERRLYDWSLSRWENRDERYVWPHEVDLTQRDYAPATYFSEVDEEGNRKTALFFVGWFVLSIITSIFLKNPN